MLWHRSDFLPSKGWTVFCVSVPSLMDVWVSAFSVWVLSSFSLRSRWSQFSCCLGLYLQRCCSSHCFACPPQVSRETTCPVSVALRMGDVSSSSLWLLEPLAQGMHVSHLVLGASVVPSALTWPILHLSKSKAIWSVAMLTGFAFQVVRAQIQSHCSPALWPWVGDLPATQW